MTALKVGIDLGHDLCRVGQVMANGSIQPVHNRANEAATPAFVGRLDEAWLVGRAARDLGERQAQAAVGDPIGQLIAGRSISLNGKTYSADDILTVLLTRLREDVELRLGESITEAVLAAPTDAPFSFYEAIGAAAERAKLPVRRIVPASVAAAVSCLPSLPTQPTSLLLVVDWASSHLSTTLLLSSGASLAYDSAGVGPDVGMERVRQVVTDYALAEACKEYGVDGSRQPRFMCALQQSVDKALRELEQDSSSYLVVVGMLKTDDGESLDVELELKRSRYEEMALPIVKQAADFVATRVAETVGSTERLDGVLLAGAGARLPLVQRSMEQRLGLNWLPCSSPEFCAALGAARLAVNDDFSLRLVQDAQDLVHERFPRQEAQAITTTPEPPAAAPPEPAVVGVPPQPPAAPVPGAEEELATVGVPPPAAEQPAAPAPAADAAPAPDEQVSAPAVVADAAPAPDEQASTPAPAPTAAPAPDEQVSAPAPAPTAAPAPDEQASTPAPAPTAAPAPDEQVSAPAPAAVAAPAPVEQASTPAPAPTAAPAPDEQVSAPAPAPTAAPAPVEQVSAPAPAPTAAPAPVEQASTPAPAPAAAPAPVEQVSAPAPVASPAEETPAQPGTTTSSLPIEAPRSEPMAAQPVTGPGAAATAPASLATVQPAAQPVQPTGAAAGGQSPLVFGQYHVVRELSRDSFYTCYLAQVGNPSQSVLLRVYPGADKWARRGFASALTAYHIRHPNIESIIEFGAAGDSFFIAYDYTQKTTLKDLLRNSRQNRLPLRRALQIEIDLLEALSALQRVGIFHRNVKPENIIVGAAGTPARLAGFEICTLLAPGQRIRSAVGSLRYIAPEAISGEADCRADLYSAAVILYEMATGVVPFRPQDSELVQRQIVNETPAPPQSLNPALTRSLNTIIMAALDKNPERRRLTAEDLRQVLQAGPSASRE